MASRPVFALVNSLAIVVPVLGRDYRFLSDLLVSIEAQDSQPTEVIVATDHPHDLEIDTGTHLPIRVLPNPGGAIARALNLAIQSTTCDFIIRLDVRARPAPDYVRRCLALLDDRTDIVGGKLLILPGGENVVSAAIAMAVSHPLGAGDARYRIGGVRGEVDTVPFPCFRRSLWERLGGYNEALGANEDYEFNWRARKAGGRLLFDPDIQCGYIARESYRVLAGQYFRYGWWKVQMLKQHPRSVRWRQLLPIIAPALLLTTALMALFMPALIWLVLGLTLAYFCLLVAVGLQHAIRQRSPSLSVAFSLAILIIHSAWSAGAWLSLITHWRWPFR